MGGKRADGEVWSFEVMPRRLIGVLSAKKLQGKCHESMASFMAHHFSNSTHIVVTIKSTLPIIHVFYIE